ALGQRFETQARLANLQQGALDEFRFAHPDAVDTRAIAAAEVPDPDGAVGVRENLTVKAGRGSLVQLHLVQRVRAQLKPVTGGFKRLAGLRPVENVQPKPPDA